MRVFLWEIYDMNKLYVLLFVCLVIFGAFFVGQNVGKLKCQKNTAINEINNETKIIKITEKINAETFHTGVADIRRILRDEYTIAE